MNCCRHKPGTLRADQAQDLGLIHKEVTLVLTDVQASSSLWEWWASSTCFLCPASANHLPSLCGVMRQATCICTAKPWCNHTAVSELAGLKVLMLGKKTCILGALLAGICRACIMPCFLRCLHKTPISSRHSCTWSAPLLYNAPEHVTEFTTQ